MAVPSLGKLSAHMDLKRAAEVMVLDFRRTQSLAVRQNSTHTVDFTLSTLITLGDGSQYTGMYQVNAPSGSLKDALPPTRYLGTPTGTVPATLAANGYSPTVLLVSAVDGGGTASNSISFGSSGYVTAPTVLPFTVKLRSCRTGEAMEVQVERIGRIHTVPIARESVSC